MVKRRSLAALAASALPTSYEGGKNKVNFRAKSKYSSVEVTHERNDVRRVGNDGDSDLGEISLDLSNVALLLLTVSEVLPLVGDRSTSSGSGGRRNRSSLRNKRKANISL